MHIDGYRQRVVDRKLESYLRTFGAVCVEGPKWCGKTWTSRRQSKSEFLVADPSGNFQNRKMVSLDIAAAFQGEKPHLIDEWQEFPELWDATRSYVDNSTEKGRYILAGSSTPNRKGVMHSGTGRIASLRMHTMSLWEAGESEGLVSFKDICENRFDGVIRCQKPDLRRIAEWIIRGGWPAAIDVPFDDAISIPREYIRQVAANDIHRIDDIKRDVGKVDLLLRSLARNETTTASISTLCYDMSEIDGAKVDPDTVASYLNALARLFVLENQPPFHSNIRSTVRVKQAAKRHFCDPSIACALLKLTPQRLLEDLNFMGFLFEALVERDLRIYCEGMNADLMHYQDYGNRELDAVVEMESGAWAAVEIKIGVNQEEDAAARLVALRDEMKADPKGKPPESLVLIVGMSSAAYRRPDGVIVVPVGCLAP